MKKIIPVCLLALLLPSVSIGQANSITLKDGTGTTINSYNSINAAYAAIPATVTQAYIVEINSSYTGANETLPVNFTSRAGTSATNTITLRPAAGVTNAVISGSYTNSNGGVVQLNGIDYMILDGRAGGTGSTSNLTITNTSVAANAHSVHLRDNATRNIIRYCKINNATTTNVGCTIDAVDGTSDNVVEHSVLTGSRYGVRWAGGTGNLSQNNKIYNCDFLNICFSGFWGRPGLGKITIDSCRFYNNTASNDSPTALLFDSQTDTVTISRNKIYNLYGTSTSTIKAISIRTVTGTNYFKIYNNFISLSPSIGATIMGIDLASTSAVGHIAFNNIRMTGTLTSGGSAGTVSSTCINKASNAATYTILNNICMNDRSGGAGLHVAVNYVDLVNVTADYNTYNATSGNLVRYTNTNYTAIATYQAAVTGKEMLSNAQPVNFVSATDLHLTGASINNTNLAGIAVPFVTTDIDGTPRSAVPTRGAHEASGPSCTGNPAVAVITGPTATICGTTTNFTLTATGQTTGSGISYKWQSRVGTAAFADIPAANGTSLTTSASQTTDYRFVTTCAATGSTPSVSNIVTVTVLSKPTATVTAGGPLTFCAGGSVALNVATGAGFTYQWRLNNAPIAAATAASYTATAPGSYRVIVSNGTCVDTSAASVVTVTPAPTAVITPAGPTTFCQGVSVILSASTGANYTYQWKNGGTDITGATAASYTATAAGNYTVVVTAGCAVTSAPVAVTVNPSPAPATITPASAPAFCYGGSVVLNASSTSTVYQWLNGNIPINGATSAAYTASASGTYKMRVTAPNGCTSVSDSIVVTVFPNFAPLVNRLGNILSTDPGYTSYQWYRGGVAIPGATTYQYTLTRDGMYTVRVVNISACGGTSVNVPVNNLAVNNLPSEYGIMIYPNPAGAVLHIEAKQAVDATILAVDGKEILKARNAGLIDVSGLASGLYFIRITHNKSGQILGVQKFNKR